MEIILMRNDVASRWCIRLIDVPANFVNVIIPRHIMNNIVSSIVCN